MKKYFLIILVVVAGSHARRLRDHRSHRPRETSFVGEATNELATAIFQGYIDDDRNIAFSPLGYSAILAILAEGARGETRDQLVTALHLPKDPNITRKTYKFIMERLKNTHEYKYNQPELKNYFYIYKNYTIQDDYKKILENYYLTEVRSVERYKPEMHVHVNVPEEEQDVIEVTDKSLDEYPNSEDSPEFMPPKVQSEKLISFAVEDKPEKVDVSQQEYKPAKNIKEQIKFSKNPSHKEDREEAEETMVAVEARNHARSLQVLMDKNDISSSISVNSVGNKSNPSSSSNSLMIIFNGMYFRGSWKKAFEKVEQGIFYKSNTEKKNVQMMKTKGVFRTATLPGLDSEAVEIPYDGGRYVLLVVLPRKRDGLARLTADLPATPLVDIEESLQEEELQLSIPSFYMETTTKPVSALAKFGVSRIFSREAQLGGVAAAGGLFVQEMVQHVSVRVDNADSSASELSASNVAGEAFKSAPLRAKPARRFSAEHPFLYLIVDRLDRLVVVAGKLLDPETPASFDI